MSPTAEGDEADPADQFTPLAAVVPAARLYLQLVFITSIHQLYLGPLSLTSIYHLYIQLLSITSIYQLSSVPLQREMSPTAEGDEADPANQFTPIAAVVPAARYT